MEKEKIFTNYTKRDLEDHNAISFIIKNEKNEYLLFYHNKFRKWTTPMGKCEINQTPEQGILQEAKEEVGIDITKMKLIVNFKKEYNRNDKIIKANIYIYEVEQYKGKIENLEKEKHSVMKWVSMKHIKQIGTENRTDVLNKLVELYGDY